MKTEKKQKLEVETVPSVDLELNDEQLEAAAGGVYIRDNIYKPTPTFPTERELL